MSGLWNFLDAVAMPNKYNLEAADHPHSRTFVCGPEEGPAASLALPCFSTLLVVPVEVPNSLWASV